VPARPDGNGELAEFPWLLFELQRQSRAIPLSAIDGVVELATIRALRHAPPGVRGLSHWRGSLITVLAVDGSVPSGRVEQGCIVRLAGRFSGTAFHLPRPPRVGWSTSDPSGARIVCDDASFLRVEPAELIAELLGAAER